MEYDKETKIFKPEILLSLRLQNMFPIDKITLQDLLDNDTVFNKGKCE